MIFNFPVTVFVETNGIFQQVEKICEEAVEARRAVMSPDINEVAEEVMDCLHACETAIAILRDKYGVSPSELRNRVEAKNQLRYYYRDGD